MEVTGSTLATLGVGFSAAFQSGLAEAPMDWKKVATEVPSTTSEQEYGWLKDWPAMREWVGDRLIKELSGDSYKIKNKAYESTVAVKKPDIEDDKVGMYAARFKAQGKAAGQWQNNLVWAALKLGLSEKCYDGQNFFDTDHPVGSKENGNLRTLSNLQDGSKAPWFLLDVSQAIMPIIFQLRKKPEMVAQTDPNNSDHVFKRNEFLYGVDARGNVGFSFWQLAYCSKQDLTAENYSLARQSMSGLKNDEDQPLGIMPRLLVVGPGNEAKARKLLKAEKLANGEDNIWQGTAELFVSPWLD
ncbi:Mu-like prophage major head subunit gpT family protein [Pseudovibrio exalbescens]|uniref:Mu-like prophage major head subunit gpT family protein n=1 Tax=Pseudovibrio exalbescens TaxID=197461 RepID=UPI0023673537|nr:Mu-like prophage major head subunit gpT family protein [Pseudovibrio exalbescens]MDD7908555.1 Mu-like prophage major head subunit gpT family protein [Pseudovibrio exalbescens]